MSNIVIIKESKTGSHYFDYKGNRCVIVEVKPYSKGLYKDVNTYVGTVFSKSNKAWKSIPDNGVLSVANQVIKLIDGEL